MTSEESRFIRANYRKADSNESSNWITVCSEGSDWKYGHYKIDPEKMIWRNVSFDEFYKGGIVD